MHFAQTIAAVHFCWLTAHLYVSKLSLSLSLLHFTESFALCLCLWQIISIVALLTGRAKF